MGANDHLTDVYRVAPGDVVFLPIPGTTLAELKRRHKFWPEEAFRNLRQIGFYEAGRIRSRFHLGSRDRDSSDDFIEIDKQLLQLIMDRCAKTKIKSKLDLATVSDMLNRSMKLAEATNRRREVAFLSQAVIETDYFRTFEEYRKGAGKPYAPYYGRGIHQLTWKDTYEKGSHALFKDDRLVKNPDLILSDNKINIQTTAWYWRDHKSFNSLADDRNIDEIIHKLYGGTSTSKSESVRESVKLRQGYYKTIKALLNERDGKRI